jgi:hypothetical protein
MDALRPGNPLQSKGQDSWYHLKRAHKWDRDTEVAVTEETEIPKGDPMV